MPGWNIVADLTPPELINARWIAVLKRRIAIALSLVLVLCAAAYAYAVLTSRSAKDQAAVASDRAVYLKRTADSYVGITRIETAVSSIDAQVSTVMSGDVDVARVISLVRRGLPPSMTIQAISLSLNAEGVVEGTAGLDTSGSAPVGRVTVSGSGRSLDDVPAFVDALTAVPGVVDVVPTSNQVSDGSAQYSVAITLTEKLYSHRYDDARKRTGR
jgi:hypothetical protein